MRIDLYRLEIDHDATIGELRIDGEWFCWTLEDLVRAAKIKHKTAIPAGHYPVKITYSNRFKIQMPLLLGVPEYEGVRIHPGNDAEDTSGCLLVGGNRQGNRITDSRAAYQALMQRLEGQDKIDIYIWQPENWPKWGEVAKLAVRPNKLVHSFAPNDKDEDRQPAAQDAPVSGDVTGLVDVTPPAALTSSSIQVTKNSVKAALTTIGVGGFGALGSVAAFFRDNQGALKVFALVIVFIVALAFLRWIVLDLARMKIGADPEKLNVH